MAVDSPTDASEGATGLSILIPTTPLAAPAIEQVLSRWLPPTAWNLEPLSTEGHCWKLELATVPCSETVRRLFGAP